MVEQIKAENLDKYRAAAAGVLEYIEDNAFSFEYSDEEIKKTRDEFLDEFSAEKLKQIPDDELLTKLFYADTSNNSLCYHLEMNKMNRSMFGGISGGSAYKFGLFKKKETGIWTSGSPIKPIELSEEDALVRAKEIRDALVRGAGVVKSFEVRNESDAELLDQKIHESIGNELYNWSWVHKYLSLIRPDLLCGFHNNDWQYHILHCLEINPSDKCYARSAQIALIARFGGLGYSHFYEIIVAKYGGVKVFYRLEAGDNDYLKKNSVIAMGWGALGSLKQYAGKASIDKKMLSEKLQREYYYDEPKTANKKAQEIVRFYSAGDNVIFYIADGEKGIGLADNAGEYEYRSGDELSHIRPVRWIEAFNENETLPHPNEGLSSACSQIKNEENLQFLYQKYYSSRKDNSPFVNDEYWPSIDEYDPGITAEQWVEFLKKDRKNYPKTLLMLKTMLDAGGEETCSTIGKAINESTSACINRGSALGERAAKHFDIEGFEDEEGKVRYYIVPFTVKRTGDGSDVWKLRSELIDALEAIDSKEQGEGIMFDKNMILYGPPGTGKTYESAIYAVAICDGKSIDELSDYDAVMERYDKLKAEGRIAFTTFHQSYGYEEFIEGIKPVLDGEGSSKDIKYTIESGVFKAFCERAADPEINFSLEEFGVDGSFNSKVWQVFLGGTGDTEIKRRCFDEGSIRIGWSGYSEFIGDEEEGLSEDTIYMLHLFQDSMQIGDLVVTCSNLKTIDAVGVITGDYEYELGVKDYSEDYPRKRNVKWLATDLSIDVPSINSGKQLSRSTVISLKRITSAEMLKQIKMDGAATPLKKNNYVFVIDEINRGNISKIFGELITLIEKTKRAGEREAMEAVLPYSGDPFSVPTNVYLLGTMNTADRSIALMDTALRRRFSFIEMMPQADVLRSIGADKVSDGGETLDVAKMLEVINERIEYLFDREHTIGHAFFTSLKDDPSIRNLSSIFKKSVIPLLQEYFYEDYSKIQLVLGDNDKTDPAYKFILDVKTDQRTIFNGNPDVDLPENKYEIQDVAFENINSYKEIGSDL